MASEERCIMCNEVIPEGRQVCPACTEKVMNNEVLNMNNNVNNNQTTYELGVKICNQCNQQGLDFQNTQMLSQTNAVSYNSISKYQTTQSKNRQKT